MKTLHFIASTLVLSILFYSCDKNESAPLVADQEFFIEENSQAGTIVGAIDASDPDEGQVVSYEIIDGNTGESFTVAKSSGILSVNNPEKLDYEAIQQLTLTISVSDNHDKDPLESTAKVRVNLTDKNEFAPVIEAQTFELNENSTRGYEIGTIIASDEEIHQTLHYSLLESNDKSYFHLDSATGKLSVLDSAAFDFESQQVFNLAVQVSDSHTNSKTAQANIQVNVQDVLEITDGLIVHLPFNGNVEDSWGEYNGTAHNVDYAKDDQIPANEFLSLPGQDSYVVLNDPFDLETITINLSFKVENANDDLGILYTSDNPELIHGMTLLSVKQNAESKVELYYNFSNLINTVEIEEGKWYNVTMTRDAKSYSHYLNGNLIGSGEIDDYVSSYNGNPITVLGSVRTTTSYYYNGFLDNLRIYNRVISTDEIHNLITE